MLSHAGATKSMKDSQEAGSSHPNLSVAFLL